MRRQVSRGAGGREGARGRGLPPAAASCHGRQALGGTVLEGRGPGEGNPGRCHHSWVLGKQQCWAAPGRSALGRRGPGRSALWIGPQGGQPCGRRLLLLKEVALRAGREVVT